MNAQLMSDIKAIPTTPEKQPAPTPAGTWVFTWDVPKGATMARAMIQRKGCDCRFDLIAETFDGKDWTAIGGGAHDSKDDPDDTPEGGLGWAPSNMVGAVQIRLTIVSSKEATFGVSVGFA